MTAAMFPDGRQSYKGSDQDAKGPPESETPETDAAEEFAETKWNKPAKLMVSADFARSLERRLSLAQTEIKGHMRVVDELKAELEKAYQMLELNGVPRERAKSVANGIDVLASRFDKQNHFYEQALARENAAQARIAELEKVIYESRMPHGLCKLAGSCTACTAQQALDRIADAALKSRA